jgi:hypothetical protein
MEVDMGALLVCRRRGVPASFDQCIGRAEATRGAPPSPIAARATSWSDAEDELLDTASDEPARGRLRQADKDVLAPFASKKGT